LHINNSIDVKKLDIEPNIDGEVFTIYDTGSNKIFIVNTSTKIAEINGSLIIDDLDINKLVITDGNKKLISTLTLPDNCIINNSEINNSEINDPIMVFTGNNDSVLMTNGGGQVYCSTTLPNNVFMANATLTDPYISNPFIGFGVGQANKLLITGVSGNTITSLTLPNNCNSTNQTLTTPTINGVNSALVPTSTYDLGSTSNRWNNFYGNNTNTNMLIVNTGVGSILLPDVDINRSLGNQSYRWKTLYTQNLTDNGNNITIYGANNGNKFQILDNTNVSCFNVNTSQGGRIWIGGSNQTAKFIIADQDGNSVFDLRTGSNGRINIAGLNTQNKFNVTDQDGNAVLSINTGQNGRISVGGLGTANKFNIYDADGNILLGSNSSSGAANVSIQGPAYNYKFSVIDGTGTRVFNVNTNNGIINSIGINPIATSTYDLGTNSLKWNNVYANNLYGSWTPTGNLIPSVNNAYDIGSSSYRWNNLYSNNINTNGITINSNGASLIDPALNSTTTLFIGSGTSTAGASSYSHSIIQQGIKGLGGGNVYLNMDLWYDSGYYSWQISGGISFIKIATHVIPSTNLTYDLGGPGGIASIYWRNLYVQQIIGSGTLMIASHIRPSIDNTYACGINGARWTQVWAVNGIIQTSDGNDKENIQECELGLDFINDLKPKKYNWKGEKGNHYGIVAQDLEETLNKHACCDFKGLHKPEDEKDKYGINYSQLIPILIKSVQELSAEVERLKNLLL